MQLLFGPKHKDWYRFGSEIIIRTIQTRCGIFPIKMHGKYGISAEYQSFIVHTYIIHIYLVL